MNILDLEEKLKELLILESNLKKSIYKKFLHKTLLEKQRLNNQLYDYVQTGLINLEDSLSESKLTYFEKASRQAFLCVQQILNTKLAHTKRTIPFKTLVSTIIILRRLKPEPIVLNIQENMANATEIIKIASSLIPQYDGNGEKLNNITAALKALKTVVTAATEPVAIQIILSKLEGKARSAVGDSPVDIEAIINNLTRKCKQSMSSDVVLAKLNATRQSGALNKFTSEIEELTSQLEAAYIGDNIPLDTATKMANKAGIKALSNGLKSLNTQLIVKAGTFSTLNEAIGRAAENDQEETPSMKVLHYGQRGGMYSFNHDQRYRSFYQNNHRTNSEQRDNTSRFGGYNQNFRGNNNSNSEQRDNTSRFRGYNSNSRGGNNSNWYRGNNNSNRGNGRNYSLNYSNGHRDQHQERYNSNRHNPSHGRIYHATTQENDSPLQNNRNNECDDRRETGPHNFLGGRADQIERSSQ